MDQRSLLGSSVARAEGLGLIVLGLRSAPASRATESRRLSQLAEPVSPMKRAASPCVGYSEESRFSMGSSLRNRWLPLSMT